MDNLEREAFWNALCNIHDNTSEHIQYRLLKEAIK